MEHEIFEVCVFNLAEDDYVVTRSVPDPNEAIECLIGLAKLGIEACVRYYYWYTEKET